jgi:hypothetical protein
LQTGLFEPRGAHMPCNACLKFQYLSQCAAAALSKKFLNTAHIGGWFLYFETFAISVCADTMIRGYARVACHHTMF